MEINKSNGINFNSDFPISKNIQNKKANTKESKEFNYSKINHPGDVLGRSMVNFRGNKKPELPQITKEELIKKTEAGENYNVSSLAHYLKEDMDEENAPYAAFILDIIKDREEIGSHAKSILLTCVNAENFEFVKKISSDENLKELLKDTVLIKDIMKYATEETAEFFHSFILDKKIDKYDKRHFFMPVDPEYNKGSSREDVLKYCEDKAKVYHKIQNSGFDEELQKKLLELLEVLTPANLNLAVLAISSGESEYNIKDLIQFATPENEDFIKTVYKDETLRIWDLKSLIEPDENKSYEENQANTSAKFEVYKIAKENLGKEGIKDEYNTKSFLEKVNTENVNLAKSLAGIKGIQLDEKTITPTYYDKKRDEELYKKKEAFILKHKDDKNLDVKRLNSCLSALSLENADLLETLYDDVHFPEYSFKDQAHCGYLCTSYEEQKEIFDTRKKFHTLMKENSPNGRIDYNLLSATDIYNVSFAKKLIEDGIVNINLISSMINPKENITSLKEEAIQLKEEMYDKLKTTETDSDTILDIVSQTDRRTTKAINEFLNDGDFPHSKIATAVSTSPEICLDFYKKNKTNQSLTFDDLVNITCSLEYSTKEFARTLLDDEKYPNDKIAETIFCPNIFGVNVMSAIHERMDLYDKYKDGNEIDKECLAAGLTCIGPISTEKVENVLLNAKKLELTPNAIEGYLFEEIDYEKFKKALNKIGKEKLQGLTKDELKLYIDFVDIYGKNNINEIPIYGKRELLRSLVKTNADIFDLKEEIRKDFPMLPKNQEEYCSLLPSIVKSIGLETNVLSEDEIKEFNQNITSLSGKLSNMTDDEFNNLEISLEHSKDEFTEKILEKINGLPKAEKQKVFDYFGFELSRSKENQTGYTLVGYPMNLNNGKKLREIQNAETKKVIEDIRPFVVEFSENNKVQCTNKEIEPLLNEIINALPELRSEIGRIQTGMNGTKGSHEFDIFKYSLKVMQKIVQNPEYEKLSPSDKKLMLLASLLHDITKREGKTDKTHANESSFDAFYIAKKFNLSKDDEIKLYTLIKNHEWLTHVNTANTDEERTKRLQSAAYDFRHDNLFDMALIFTHADLKAVKKSDEFHDKVEGRGRKVLNGKKRSFGESAEIYAGKKTDDINSNTIRGYINELKKSQPILPTTEFPKASEIEKAITKVYADGSTNIKGVYKDENGVVVVKYNEVEDFEAIGFKKGSKSRGIETTTNAGEKINTGNIKFIAHGLDFPNQLIKFDAFPLPDSDALLSVSYAECPESKYRFFRPQGILLNVETKYIHGGGETDAGSGCGKKIGDFKENYLFGGCREKDRLCVSELIKKALNLTDEEYVEFVKENENKSIGEIVPKEKRDTLIKAFASINSNERNGGRAYNEMYISNPKSPMGVFVYDLDKDKKIGNPIEFLNRTTISDNENSLYTAWKMTPLSVKERTEFIKQYAKERDLPLVVFGD